MSSSNSPPPASAADRMTVENLIISLRSQTCPACGQTKDTRKSVCGRCYRRLPIRLKTDLYRRMDDGYERAMAQALRALKRTRFILPGDSIALSIGQQPLQPELIAPLLETSNLSVICPACAGDKPALRAMCPDCRRRLRAAGIASAQLFVFRPRIDNALLATDPSNYAANLIQAIQMLKGKVFHYPKE